MCDAVAVNRLTLLGAGRIFGSVDVRDDPFMTVGGLVNFLTTSSVVKRQEIVAEFKYPKEEGGIRRANFYQPALDVITRFYRKQCDESVLSSSIHALSSQVPSTAYEQTKFRSNVEVLRCFEQNFAKRAVRATRGRLTKVYRHAGVDVNVTVDLPVLERHGGWHFVWLQFAQTSDPQEHGKIVCQLLYEVLRRIKLAPSPSAMRVWNCRTGQEYKLARLRSRTAREIRAACETIALMWPNV